MTRRSGVQHRLTRLYLLQLILISATTVLGVWFTAQIIERVLVKEALAKEAEHYWDLYQENPRQPRPNTRHLLGFLETPQGADVVPPALAGLPAGFHRVPLEDREPIVYVEARGEKRLYLVFDEQRVAVLAFLFGILPLTGVLLVIYLTAFLAWRKSRQLMSPLVKLAEILRRTPVTDPGVARPDLSEVQAETDSEVAVLVGALEAYAERLLAFVDRERQFTRDASHELRTPLAVIRANLELLDSGASAAAARRRMDDTVEDMEALIETLLILARSEHHVLDSEVLVVNDLVHNLVERLAPLAERKQVQILVRQHSLLELEGTEVVLGIILTNLLRNAINYTGSGCVTIDIGTREITVSDTGPGMDEAELARLMQPFERGSSREAGHGLGLAIVHRLCERCRWSLDVASAPGQGTRIKITFPPKQAA